MIASNTKQSIKRLIGWSGIRNPVGRTGLGLKSVIITWAMLVATGMTWVNRYGTLPGDWGETPSEWPADAIELEPGQAPGLWMFAHPRCPCTRASLNELQRIAHRAEIQANVVFWQPDSSVQDENWSESDLIRLARSHPNLQVHLDHGGELTDRFDARTSGMCLVFDVNRQLVFRGGVTSSRGHEGESEAHSLILDALQNPKSLIVLGPKVNSSRVFEHPVFGCQTTPGT